jgi:hypothetical protein
MRPYALFRRLFLLAASVPIVLPAADFDGLVREFSRQTGAQPMHIPFFGLARFVVAVSHPAGTSDLRLAVFEHVNAGTLDFGHMAAAQRVTRAHSTGRFRRRRGDVCGNAHQARGPDAICG